MLSDSEDESYDSGDHQLTVNEHYAKAFQYRKEREELEKLKAKLGSDVSESDIEEETDSESAESEDEDGEELTPTLDAAILRTLARIKRKDPSIYEPSKGIFEEEQGKIASKAPLPDAGHQPRKAKESSKPVTLRQVALEAQLNPSRSPTPEPLTHVEEQHKLRKEAISAFHTAISNTDDDNNDEDDELLVPREKTKDEQEREEEEYRAFLEREVGDLKEIVGDVGAVYEEAKDINEDDLEGKKRKKKKTKTGGREDQSLVTKTRRKSKQEEDQEFLMNYILNRGWIDKSRNRVPTYQEVTSKKKKSKNAPDSDSDPDTGSQLPTADTADAFSESSFDSLADVFETSYNFRFEEPDSAHIPSFPRNIPSLVRREDSKRKDARERRKQRKEEEVQKKKEEVRRLKALKMREIRRKLEVIGKESGILRSGRKVVRKEDRDADGEGEGESEVEVNAALRELDLEGDWDPEKHDRQMAGLFASGDDGEDGDRGWEDGGEADEDGKPIWKDDIDIGDIPILDDAAPAPTSKKKKKKKKKKDEEREQEGVDVDAMDADIQAPRMDNSEDEEEWDGTEEMRKKKLDEYMEEIYKLDFNDMVGDIPTRFKYAPVASQAYSLTPVEILLATDKELNEFMSVKKYAPYRTETRKWDAKRQQRLKEFRATIAERTKAGGWQASGDVALGKDAATPQWGNRDTGKAKKRKGKKERLKAKAAEAQEEEPGEGLVENGGNADAETNERGRREGKRKRNEIETLEMRTGVELDGVAKPKKKRRRKHKNGGEGGGV